MLRRFSTAAGVALVSWSRLAAADDTSPEPTPSTQAPDDDAKVLPPAEEDVERPAEPEPLGPRAWGQVRLLASVSTFSGESLVETGSVGRYRLGGGNLELEADRLFGVVGFILHVGGFYIPDADELSFIRGEGGVAFGVASWEGEVPGGVLLGLGMGGDYGRYWFSEEGRFYGMARAHLRLWPSPDVPLQLTYTAVPGAYTAVDGYHHEHRIELATGWSMLTFGSRLGLAYTTGGEPSRTFSHVELGTFVGFGLYE